MAHPGPVKRWIEGARPRTLPAAIVPVAVGTAAAGALHFNRFVGEFMNHSKLYGPCPAHAAFCTSVTIVPATSLPGYFWLRAVAALVVALAIQVGTNYANDYSDGIRGTDEVRVGPLRLVGSGLVAPKVVKRAAFLAFGIAAVVGLALAAATSWWILLVGAAALLSAWFYTGGKHPYGYLGLGEVFVFVFFGLVATVGTFYVESERLDLGVIWAAGVAVGLLAMALLLANNVRDIATDLASGKRTLAARLGRRAGGWCYAACVLLPFLGVLVWGIGSVTHLWVSWWPASAFLPLLALPLVVAPVRIALSDAEGRALLPVLAATGKLQMAFGALLAVALLLWVVY